MSILTKVLRAGEGKKLKALKSLIPEINALGAEMEALTNDDLARKTGEFRERLARVPAADVDDALNDLLFEAFAVVREVAWRTLKQRHYDEQLMGGAALHFGWIAEMKTGEGKTLVSTLPVYLNALAGRGVHLVTVNDYLARRDAEWMGQIHKWLGLSVGLVIAGDQVDRKAQYACDVTYGTNNEFGFDYLRDNMAMTKAQMVQRGHRFAIVDEVDSILVDEARTPLIISGQVEDAASSYARFAAIVRDPRPGQRGGLLRDVDYEVDEEKRTVVPLESGIQKVEQELGVHNLYDELSANFVHYLLAALRAKELYKRDVDYVVQGRGQDREVKIVDEFTGRVLEGRRWSEGLHQSVEAKEQVPIKSENQTLATITLQNYYRLYDKLAGMTGTAETEAAEFAHTYNLPVVPIPPHRRMVRRDHADTIYKTEEAKFSALADDLGARYEAGQPVLVGTVSVEKSERLSRMLDKRNVVHSVLNAKKHASEAQLVAQAGRSYTVTVATNMAGRGVDIILGGNYLAIARKLFAGEEGPGGFGQVTVPDADQVATAIDGDWARRLQSYAVPSGRDERADDDDAPALDAVDQSFSASSRLLMDLSELDPEVSYRVLSERRRIINLFLDARIQAQVATRRDDIRARVVSKSDDLFAKALQAHKEDAVRRRHSVIRAQYERQASVDAEEAVPLGGDIAKLEQEEAALRSELKLIEAEIAERSERQKSESGRAKTVRSMKASKREKQRGRGRSDEPAPESPALEDLSEPEPETGAAGQADAHVDRHDHRADAKRENLRKVGADLLKLRGERQTAVRSRIEVALEAMAAEIDASLEAVRAEIEADAEQEFERTRKDREEALLANEISAEVKLEVGKEWEQTQAEVEVDVLALISRPAPEQSDEPSRLAEQRERAEIDVKVRTLRAKCAVATDPEQKELARIVKKTIFDEMPGHIGVAGAQQAWCPQYVELLREWKEGCLQDGEKVRDLGGLYVLGTERHESRRIDNQLRGRSGRQGDPGESRFFLSMEDDLMRLFATGAMSWVMDKALPEDVPIEAKMVTKAIEKAQGNVESRNGEIRKDVLKYDEVMNEQRKVIYRRRQQILNGEDLREEALTHLTTVVGAIVRVFCPNDFTEDWDLEELVNDLRAYYPTTFTVDTLAQLSSAAEIEEVLVKEAVECFLQREAKHGHEHMREIERQVMLKIIDQRWMEHLAEMDYLREGINLRAMGQRDPLTEWQREGYDMFTHLIAGISDQFVRFVMQVEVVQESAPEPHIRNVQYSAPEDPAQAKGLEQAAARQAADLGEPTAAIQAVAGPAQVIKSDRERLGRNDLCWCESGKKFKNCHGK